MIRKLIRFRKQHDWCKVAIACLTVSIIIFVVAGIQLVKFISYMAEPVTYEITSGDIVSNSASDIVSDRELDLDKLMNQTDVVAVTEEIDQSITFSVHEKEITIPCHAVSADYIEAVYGVSNENAMIVFYANKVAYDQLWQENNKNSYSSELGESDDESSELQLHMILCDEDSAQKKLVKVILLNQIAGEEAILYQSVDSYTLAKNRTDVRIYYAKKDYNHEHEKAIMAAGYCYVMPDQIRLEAYERQIEWMKLRNLIIIGILLAGTSWATSFGRNNQYS